MRICVLLSPYQAGSSPLADLDPLPDPARWLDGHEVDVVLVHKQDATAQVQALAGRGYDVFLNLCDGTWLEEIAGVEVVEELERLGLPFTGPTAQLYNLTKAQMKQAAVDLGVPTPAFVFAQSHADVERAARTLHFPLIVKHFDSCGSIGMTRASCVQTYDALVHQVRDMLALAGEALIEEFIEGDEYTVLVAENPEEPDAPLVFTPVRCAFPQGETFKHFDLKWKTYATLEWKPCTDERLAARLTELTRRIFVGLQGVSYARCDFRVDARGEAWFLEINLPCGMFYVEEGSADMILRYDPIGPRAFLDHILRCAITRNERKAAGERVIDRSAIPAIPRTPPAAPSREMPPPRAGA
ncbi:ATP-grasp domain-containing protein [Polyangium jinanense]|uniref:ATP-grasp domain-containing protein n=1 Tax=Polyangium jinanense TaxID=2829994 RepID=A0A9X3XE52_9BACT|nr:ATP-grasp domain-containing protein [Polyangium jinanense]MDC3962707.1 ATP-grasp domain-containing protein [Polyangium jinanense]MDC3987760.1 ATP-grasp domain-containing protein [Polyangium jinanense]